MKTRFDVVKSVIKAHIGADSWFFDLTPLQYEMLHEAVEDHYPIIMVAQMVLVLLLDDPTPEKAQALAAEIGDGYRAIEAR